MARYDHIDHPGPFFPQDYENTPRPFVPSPDFPLYEKVQQPGPGKKFMITCNEGWRSEVVCTDMYEWAADWLLKVIDGRPFATKERP